MNAVQRKRKYQKTAQWIKNHPEKVAEYDLKQRPNRARANSIRRQKLRFAAIVKLGGRCSSALCGWMNIDGTTGCTDFRVLQFDHVKGGGTKHRKKIHFEGLCKQVFKDTKGKFQLLCANCNWIKAFENREFYFVYDRTKNDTPKS